MIEIVIHGKPHAQGRPRAVRCGRSVRMMDPPASRAWKASASRTMRACRGRAGLLRGPLSVRILAVFWRPLSERVNARSWCTKRIGDADNIAKSCLDAANGVLWHDDDQVAILTVQRVIGRRGEPARVEMLVERADERLLP